MARERTRAPPAKLAIKRPAQQKHHRGAAGSDDANGDAPQLSALQTPLKKPRTTDSKVIIKFEAKVAGDRKELEGLLGEEVRRAEQDDEARKQEMASLIVAALTAGTSPTTTTNGKSASNADPDMKNAAPRNAATSKPPATFPFTKIATNPLYDTAKTLNGACAALLAEYNAFEEKIAAMAEKCEGKEVVEAWERDLQDTAGRLRVGHKMAAREVGRTLGAVREGEEEDDMEADGGEEKGKKGGNELWKRLRYAERGVKRMAKGLEEVREQ